MINPTAAIHNANSLLATIDKAFPDQNAFQESSHDGLNSLKGAVETYLTPLHEARAELMKILLESPETSPIRLQVSKPLGEVTFAIHQIEKVRDGTIFVVSRPAIGGIDDPSPKEKIAGVTLQDKRTQRKEREKEIARAEEAEFIRIMNEYNSARKEKESDSDVASVSSSNAGNDTQESSDSVQ